MAVAQRRREGTGSKEGCLSVHGSLRGLCTKSETDARPAEPDAKPGAAAQAQVDERGEKRKGEQLLCAMCAEEQGEIRALQEEEGREGGRDRGTLSKDPPASLSCQVDGEAPQPNPLPTSPEI